VYVTFTTSTYVRRRTRVRHGGETWGQGAVRRESGLRGGRRGRIGASEAEASLLGDYGSLIPIQRSELHAKRKSRPPESRGIMRRTFEAAAAAAAAAVAVAAPPCSLCLSYVSPPR